MMRRLVLFDVDGTLIRRGDPDHLGAMDHGVHSAFPEADSASVHHIDYDGKVDRLIASEILALAGIHRSPESAALDPVFAHATAYYQDKWLDRHDGADDLLPGVRVLVDTLTRQRGEFALGVLTGGSRGIVAVKLERLGLADTFPVGAFGNEVPDRPSLVPLAIRRVEEHYGESFGVSRTVIVGDTPHDVHCAHVHGIPCLGVATGKYTETELRDAGADEVVATFEDVDAVVAILGSLSGAMERP